MSFIKKFFVISCWASSLYAAPEAEKIDLNTILNKAKNNFQYLFLIRQTIDSNSGKGYSDRLFAKIKMDKIAFHYAEETDPLAIANFLTDLKELHTTNKIKRISNDVSKVKAIKLSVALLEYRPIEQKKRFNSDMR